jgi:hypothetical protein
MDANGAGAEMNDKGAKTRSGRAFPAKPPWHPKPAGADASRRLGRFAVFSVSALQLLPFVPFLLSAFCFSRRGPVVSSSVVSSSRFQLFSFQDFSFSLMR